MPIAGANTLVAGTTVTVSGTVVFSNGTTSLVYDGTGYIAYIATETEREDAEVEIATGDTVKVHGAVAVDDSIAYFDASATVTVTDAYVTGLPDSSSYVEFDSEKLSTYETADGNDMVFGHVTVSVSVAADGSIAGTVDGLDSAERYLDLIPGEDVSLEDGEEYDVLGISGLATSDTVAVPFYVVSASLVEAEEDEE